MRKKDKIILWSLYFDSNKTRKQGRRVPKKISIGSPKLMELESAAKKLGFLPEIVANAAHPSCPWRKTGFLTLRKNESKGKTIEQIAKELYSLRR